MTKSKKRGCGHEQNYHYFAKWAVTRWGYNDAILHHATNRWDNPTMRCNSSGTKKSTIQMQKSDNWKCALMLNFLTLTGSLRVENLTCIGWCFVADCTLNRLVSPNSGKPPRLDRNKKWKCYFVITQNFRIPARKWMNNWYGFCQINGITTTLWSMMTVVRVQRVYICFSHLDEWNTWKFHFTHIVCQT